MIVTAEITRSPSKNGHGPLYAGGIAAVLASTCHHISFLLVALGLSNTKIVYIVTLADWARPFLIIVALISLAISYRYIWSTSSAFNSGKDGSSSQTQIIDKAFYVFIVTFVILVLMLPHFAPCTE